MKRYRFTLLAVCLVLLWLGGTDIALFLRNRAPAAVQASALEKGETPREWLRVTGGCLDLTRAINMSGEIPPTSLLVPLTAAPQGAGNRIWVETHAPAYLDLFINYHLMPDTELEKEQFLAQHRAEFYPCGPVTGMLPTPLIASNNRGKLIDLLQDAGLAAPDNALFISEGKEPSPWRGFFFAGVGLLALVRILTAWRKGEPEPAGESDLTVPPRQ